jgi:hypothetical protein
MRSSPRDLRPPMLKILRASPSSAEPPAQGRNKRWGPPKLLLLLLGAFLLFQSPARAQIREVRRILVFDDYDDIASPGVGLLNRAIFAALSQSRYQIEWHRENLDATFQTKLPSAGFVSGTYASTKIRSRI